MDEIKKMEEKIKKVVDSAIKNVVESRLHNPIVSAVNQSSDAMGLNSIHALYFLASELIKHNNPLQHRILEKELCTINKFIFCPQCGKLVANEGVDKVRTK